MALPSRVLNSGVTSLSTVAICGEGAVDITAAGTTIADAALLTSVYNRITTTAAGTGVCLPPTEMGAAIGVTNLGANPLTVYPADTNSTIVGSTSNVLIPRASACRAVPPSLRSRTSRQRSSHKATLRRLEWVGVCA